MGHEGTELIIASVFLGDLFHIDQSRNYELVELPQQKIKVHC